MLSEIFAAILLAGLAWLWLASLRAREAAVEAVRHACSGDGVQLLDDTVMLASLRMVRDGRGALALRRVYDFEFTDTGDNRLTGSVALVGSHVDMLYLEPHRAADVAPPGAGRWRVSS